MVWAFVAVSQLLRSEAVAPVTEHCAEV